MTTARALAGAIVAMAWLIPLPVQAMGNRAGGMGKPPVGATLFAECDGGRVTITWLPPAGVPDVAGYNVYISKGGEAFAKVNAALLTGRFLVDHPTGTPPIKYRVTTVTVSGNETPLSEAPELVVELGSRSVVGWPTYGADRYQSHSSPHDINGGVNIRWQKTGSFFANTPVIIDAFNNVYSVSMYSSSVNKIEALDPSTGNYATEPVAKWAKYFQAGPSQILMADPDGELVLNAYHAPYPNSMVILGHSEGPAAPPVRVAKGDRMLYPGMHSALLPATVADGLFMATDFPGTYSVQTFLGLDHDLNVVWWYYSDQELPRSRSLTYAASGCEGRAYYSGTLPGPPYSEAILQYITLPSGSFMGLPSLGENRISPLCPGANQQGESLLINRTGNIAIQMYSTQGCAGGNGRAIQMWDLTQLWPGAPPQPIPCGSCLLPRPLLGGLFQGMAYADLGLYGEHAFIPALDGALRDLDIDGKTIVPIIVAAGLPITTPAVSADRWLIVARMQPGEAYVYDMSSGVPTLQGSRPLGAFIDAAPTVGPDGTWYIVSGNVNHDTLTAIDPPGFVEGPLPSAEELDATLVELPHFIRSVGGRGETDGQFMGPEGVASMQGPSVAVADTGNSRIQVFTSEGTLTRVTGRIGNAEGHFKRPEAVSVASGAGGRLYVADTLNDRLQILGPDGDVVSSIGKSGTRAGEFNGPSGVALDSAGRIYVADTGNDRVQVFGPDGSYLRSIGRRGSGEGDFMGPEAVTVDGDGFIYVADTGNDRVVVFTAGGDYAGTLSTKDLRRPAGLAIGPDGTLYAANGGTSEVMALDPVTGTILGRLGRFGSGPGEFDSPHGLAWDNAKKLLYVADTGNDRVQVWGFGEVPAVVASVKRPDSLVIPSGAVSRLPGAGTGSQSGNQGGLSLSALTALPNPAEPRNGIPVTISGSLGRPASVTVSIRDAQGRLVRQYGPQGSEAGAFSFAWDGRTDKGTWAPPGGYRVSVLAAAGPNTVCQMVDVALANKGGNVPGGSSARGRAR